MFNERLWLAWLVKARIIILTFLLGIELAIARLTLSPLPVRLFITSILAANLFLRTPGRRFALVAFVIPLAILRNGFRILVIGLLCVHLGPQMIHSPIHKRGGPLFLVLSLIPFFLVLWLLRRRDVRTR